MGSRYPVNDALHFAAVGRRRVSRLRVIGTVDFDYVAGLLVFDHAGVLDDVGVAQPDLPARGEAFILLRRVFVEVVPLDKEDLRKRHFAGAHLRVLGVVGTFEFFGLSFGIVVDDEL